MKSMTDKSTNKKQAVIRVSGTQYVVSEGELIETDRLPAKKGEKVTPEVLLVSDGGSVEIGTPTLETKVNLEIVHHKKGTKISGMRFKAKSRYRRRFGFRPSLTVLEVKKIG
jgi:large subunit ribosomal protein L21